LAVLLLLVAVVSGVALAGVAGARRTATVLDRYLVATNQGDLGAYVMGLRAADAPKLFEGIQGVRDAASADFYLAQPTKPGTNLDFGITSSPDGRWGTELSRVIVREGRMPAPDRADEVALNRPAAEALGLRVGDTLAAETISPGSFDRMVSGRGGPVLDGPRISPKVVGLIEFGEDLQGSTQRSSPIALASPAFGRRYDGQIAVNGSTTLITTSDPSTAHRVRSAVRSFPQSGVSTVADEWVDTTRSAIDVLTIGLAIFVAIALAAGGVVIGQIISRQMSTESESLLVARAVGLPRRDRVLAIAAPIFLAATLGALLGVVIAIACSGLFPMAVARAAEPDPGLSVAPLVLLGGWLVLVAFLAGWSWFSARRADRRVVAPPPHRASRTFPRLLGIGPNVSFRLGARLAVDRDSGRFNLPTRSVLLGTAAAIAGLVAVGVFAASLDTSLHTPAAFGWTWTARPDLVSDGGDVLASLDGLAHDRDLRAVGAILKGDAQIGSRTVPLQAFYTAKGAIEPPVLAGRPPTGDNEVALGASTLEATGHSIGDTIELRLPGATPRRFAVVGEVVGNQLTETPDLGVVAVVTPEGAEQLAGVSGVSELMDSGFQGNVLLTVRGGVDERTVEARLTRQGTLLFPSYSHPAAPGRLHNLAGMRVLLLGIAGFLALIGTLALAHLLVVSTRRRAREFGTLRVLGLVRGQLRSTVWFQGLTIIIVGLAVGLPLGVALGRWAWREVLNGVGMIVAPTTPWPQLIAFVGVALTFTTLVALVPGAWAARSRVSSLLRTE
jgi:ABC-type antimicrobial peptide transport system permease subunit